MTVREFLIQHDLAAYADAFEARRVGMSDLVSLSEDDLRDELGMVSFQDRKRFKAAVASLVAGGSTPAPLSGATRFEPPTPAPLSGATRFEPSARATPSLSGATRVEPAASLPQQLGSYRVLGLLGTGGMGTVVRARHVEEGWAQQQGGDVAIKLIDPQIATNPEFRSRFMSEAALGRKVQHPGFVPTFDVISEGAWLGTVMSLVAGEPLTTKVVPGGLSLDSVIALLAPIGEAVDHLHGLGIVHRDLKPANIVVQPNGRPVVLDLGIAKDTQAGGNHTRTMTTMGTSAWMAPEQADAKHVDGAADRYAFGMIAYVLLAGQMPWPESASEARVFSNKLMGQLVPLEKVRAGVPEHVAAAVMKMVSLEAGDRYSTCVAFVGALRVDDGAAAELKVKAEAEAAAKLQTLTAKALAEAAKVAEDASARPTALPTALPTPLPIPVPTAALNPTMPSPTGWPASSYAPPQQATPPPLIGESEEVRRARTWFMWSFVSLLFCSCFAVVPIVVGWQGYQAALRGESAESQIKTVRLFLMWGGGLWLLYGLVVFCGGIASS